MSRNFNPLDIPEAQSLVAAFHAFAGDSSYTPFTLSNALRNSKLTTADTLSGQLGTTKADPSVAVISEKLTAIVGQLNADGSRRMTLTDGAFSAASTS